MSVWPFTYTALAIATLALAIVLAIEATRRHRRRKIMHPHLECGRVGKFDCDYDADISRLIGEEGNPGQGHVDSPSAWFAEFTLDPVGEARAVEHYGTRWLIAREFSDGRFAVELFDTDEQRQERLDALEAADATWDAA